ncbi:MAG: DUF2071 domain-containing protein [Roseimicrobium sp.]
MMPEIPAQGAEPTAAMLGSWAHSSVAAGASSCRRAFVADWERTLMLHYEVSPTVLQPLVPFALDVRDGKAYVSLVAFTMRGLRLRDCGWLGRLPFLPIATHEFLNVRTYVRHRGDGGIYFLAEWLPNPLSVALGRPVFGLPYRWGRLSICMSMSAACSMVR